ncbi:hypothetical protein [Leucobacter tenebrionis]|uniref:hypothetical protein n=1 Tax=Leucobacter tenebrionis TaxID=2873270 RepID=UPI001CA6E997|nr:hypothetical protein [Leucobacter tenebrionis]QZY53306.1 hypothetical protein KVY00_07815 [Leucobacter tenebrionis]
MRDRDSSCEIRISTGTEGLAGREGGKEERKGKERKGKEKKGKERKRKGLFVIEGVEVVPGVAMRK